MSNILIERQENQLVISINRPEKRNALTADMYHQMSEALEQAAHDASIKAVLIKGEGAHFTAGNDLADFSSVKTKDDLQHTVRFMYALMDCPVPVVAQIQGMAVGIGTTLLLHCDFVFAAPDTKFSLPFVNLALVPEFGCSYLLTQHVGKKRASQWLLSGEPFGAQEALAAGLINHVYESDTIGEQVQLLLSKLCAKPKEALRRSKLLINSDLDKIKAVVEEEMTHFFEQLTSEAAKEAFSAFLEKRKPDPAIYC